jgi:hypothetical protein
MMSIAWLRTKRVASEWDSSPEWLWMYFHDPTLRSRLDTMSTLDIFIVLMCRLWSHSSCPLILLTAAVRVRALQRWVGYLQGMKHSFAMYVPHVSLREGCEGNSKPGTNLLMGNVYDKAVVGFWRFPCDLSCHGSTSGRCSEQSRHMIFGGVYVNCRCGEIPRWLWGGCQDTDFHHIWMLQIRFLISPSQMIRP